VQPYVDVDDWALDHCDHLRCEPFGSLDSVTGVVGGVHVYGWAMDPDTQNPVTMHVYADGRYVGQFVANRSRPDVDDAYHRGAGYGYSNTVGVPAGSHRVCVYAINVGKGASNPEIGCAQATATPAPTPAPTTPPPTSTPSTPAPSTPAPAPTAPAPITPTPGTPAPGGPGAGRPPVATTVTITAVRYDPPGPDTRANRNREWLRLTNTGTRAVRLTGYLLRDGDGRGYRFPDTRLRPGRSLTVFTGPGRDTAQARHWGLRRHVWDNGGRESAQLRDRYGRLVDRRTWRAKTAGRITFG
jgi:hypothetical protein